jgi:hypothetical protein
MQPSAGIARNPNGSRALVPNIGPVTQSGVLQDRGILSVMVFVAIGRASSNIIRPCRYSNRWLSCLRSQPPSASEMRIESPPPAADAAEFRPQADLNRPRDPPCPTSLWNYGRPAAAQVPGRSDKRGCIGTVEGGPAIYRRVPASVSRNSGAKAAARGDSSYPSFADGRGEGAQASQRFAHRQRPVIYE